jgi:hypothetical protein
LIQGDNSPKTASWTIEGDKAKGGKNRSPTLREEIREYLTLRVKEKKTKEDLKRLREIEETHPKFRRVFNRLWRLPTCSRTGHPGIKGLPIEGEYELIYHPHRCGSLVCPVCGFYESKKKYRKVFDLLKLFVDLKGSRLAFSTFTVKPFENPTEAVEFMFKIRQKIYNTNLSERLLRNLSPLLVRELVLFYHNLKRKKGLEYAKKRVKVEIERIRKFISSLSQKVEERRREAKKVRIADLIPAIWKFEIHKTPKGWHPHWHNILGEYIPKTLLVAFWKYITKGRGEIADIRKLKGHKAVAEISKYETKPVNEKLAKLDHLWEEGKVIQSNDVEVSLEELFELELALYGRQKITVWGKWKETIVSEVEESSKDEEEKTVHLWCVDVRTKTSMFHIPKGIRLARKVGKEVSLTECVITFPELVEGNPDALREFEGTIYATGDGELKIRIKFSNEEERLWFEELLDRAIDLCRPKEKVQKLGNSDVYNPVDDDGGLPDHLREQIDLSLF